MGAPRRRGAASASVGEDKSSASSGAFWSVLFLCGSSTPAAFRGVNLFFGGFSPRLSALCGLLPVLLGTGKADALTRRAVANSRGDASSVGRVRLPLLSCGARPAAVQIAGAAIF